MSRLLTLAAFLALCASVVAPAPTYATNVSPEADLRTFVLDAADLSSGYRLNPEQSGPRPNEAAAREDVARYQQWGRIGGYNALFERDAGLLSSPTQTAVVLQGVSVYRTAEGAAAAFEYSRQRNGQAMELLGTPLVGEASLAFRGRQQGQGQGSPASETVAIQFRKGNLVQTVIVAGPMGAPIFDEAFALAQLAARRIPD